MENKQIGQTDRNVEEFDFDSRRPNNRWLVIRYIIPSAVLLLPSLVLLSYNWVASGMFFFAFWMLVILLAVREDDYRAARLLKKFGRPLSDQEMEWWDEELTKEKSNGK